MGLLDGRIAVITGSTRGNGRAMANLFSEHGANVVVTGRDEKEAQSTAEQLAREYQTSALGLKLDVSVSDVYRKLHYYVRPFKYWWHDYSMSTMKEGKKSDDSSNIPKITAKFQCFVCGAIFTTDEDRKQHLEKEGHGQLHQDETPEDMQIANKQEELDESRPQHHRKTNTTYGEKREGQGLQVEEQPNQIDWQKTIGMTIRSKEDLDMGTVIVDDDKDYQTSYSVTIQYGDRERFSIPKETIYKTDKKNLYTSLTENEILASRKDDPFSTSIRSYTRD